MKKQTTIKLLVSGSALTLGAVAIATPIALLGFNNSSKVEVLSENSREAKLKAIMDEETKVKSETVQTIDVIAADSSQSVEQSAKTTGGVVVSTFWDKYLKPELEKIIAQREEAIKQGLLEEVPVPQEVGIQGIKVDYNIGKNPGNLTELTNVYLNLYSKDAGQTMLLGLYSDQVNIYFEITLNINVNYDVIYKVLVQEIDKIMANGEILVNPDYNQPVLEYTDSSQAIQDFFTKMSKLRKEQGNIGITEYSKIRAYKDKVIAAAEQLRQSTSNLDVMTQEVAYMEHYVLKISFYDTKKLSYYQYQNGKFGIDDSRNHHYVIYNFLAAKVLNSLSDKSLYDGNPYQPLSDEFFVKLK